MAKVGLFKKMTVLQLVAISLVTAVSFACLFFAVGKFNQVDGTKSRQFFSLVQDELSQNRIPQIDGVDFAVVSLDGAVLESTLTDYPKNQTIELKLLAGIDGTKKGDRIIFSAPFLENGIQTGMLVLLIDSNLVRIDAASGIAWIVVLCLLCTMSVMLILRANFILKKEISDPLNAVSRAAKRMAGGDYSEKLLYDYPDEIGQLCHDLEILRDDLLSSRNRENELRKNEKFLLACISHDLKTPLATILGMAESLKDNLISSDKAADLILVKTAMLNKLIEDILEQTKTELGEFSIHMTESYAKNFFENELAELQTDVRKKNLNLVFSSCPDCLVNIDKQRISQVVQNLVGNAAKYTPKDGTISIDFEIKDENLIVSVKDTGIGISAVDLPFIFDKFYRGEKARTGGVSGSGLGLPISKYIVEKHGGKIECETLLGKGTEMCFSLPLNK